MCYFLVVILVGPMREVFKLEAASIFIEMSETLLNWEDISVLICAVVMTYQCRSMILNSDMTLLALSGTYSLLTFPKLLNV